MNIQGKYFSWTSASIIAGQDLISIAKTKLGLTNLIAKQLSIIASGSLAIDIGGVGTDSTLFKGTDNYYRLSIDNNDCSISSATISQTSACPVFVSMIFV
jgi:hypothetical protein